MENDLFLTMNTKRVQTKKAKAFFKHANLQPFFRFNDGVFIYRLSDEQRRVLKVDEKNPGVVIVVE